MSKICFDGASTNRTSNSTISAASCECAGPASASTAVNRHGHWYNPLVWLAERASRIDQEMACDEWVLARADESAHSEYGEAILRAARRPSGNWLMQAGMAESRSGLNRRINHLAAAHPRGVGTVIVTLLLGAAALVFLSPASHSETNSVPNLPAGDTTGSATPTAAPSTVPPAASPAPAATSQSGPPTQVEFESIFVEVDPEAAEQIFGTDSEGQQTILQTKEAQDLIQKLSQQKGTDLVSAPKVSTRSGRKAIVQVSREFPYPTEYAPPETNDGKPGPAYRIPATPTTFEVRNVGISLEVTPEITRDNRIICELTPSAVDFLGFVNYGAKGPEKASGSEDPLDVALRPVANTADVINQPIFRKREINTTVILRSGQSIVLGGLARQDKQATGAVSGFPAGFPPQQGGKEVNRTLFIFVRARLLNAKGIYLSAEEASIAPPAAPPVPISDAAAVPSAKPEPTPQAPTSSAAPRTSHPYGRPVEGRPGFVTSPWAPDKGFVDVNGFPTGTEVMCPYTQKVFLVP